MTTLISHEGFESADPVVYIYALCEPDTNEVRYVGRTFYPQARFIQHCNDEYGNPDVYKWARSLCWKGTPPRMKILHRVDGWERGLAVERTEILAHRDQLGERLFNRTEKGVKKRRERKSPVPKSDPHALRRQLVLARMQDKYNRREEKRLRKQIERGNVFVEPRELERHVRESEKHRRFIRQLEDAAAERRRQKALALISTPTEATA